MTMRARAEEEKTKYQSSQIGDVEEGQLDSMREGGQVEFRIV